MKNYDIFDYLLSGSFVLSGVMEFSEFHIYHLIPLSTKPVA